MEIVEKTYKVFDATAENISKKAETMGLSEGEVLDRLCNRLCPKDVTLAKLLTTDYLCLITEKLTDDETGEVMLHSLLTSLYLLSSTKKYDIDKILEYLNVTIHRILEDEKEVREQLIVPDDMIAKYKEWLCE